MIERHCVCVLGAWYFGVAILVCLSPGGLGGLLCGWLLRQVFVVSMCCFVACFGVEVGVFLSLLSMAILIINVQFYKYVFGNPNLLLCNSIQDL